MDADSSSRMNLTNLEPASFQPFRYSDLPAELRWRILEFTDLGGLEYYND